jgi:hypothetical protein
MKRAIEPIMASADIVIPEGIRRRSSYGIFELTIRIIKYQKQEASGEYLFIYEGNGGKRSSSRSMKHNGNKRISPMQASIPLVPIKDQPRCLIGRSLAGGSRL